MSLAASFREERSTDSSYKDWCQWLRQQLTGNRQIAHYLENQPRSGVLPKNPYFSPDLENNKKKQRSSFALIAFGHGGDKRYLLQWNENWGVYNLIGGKMDNSKGDEDCFIRTLCRELEEETGLSTPKDCRIVCEVKRIEMRQYSRREKRMKDYQFGVFEVELFPQLALPPQQQKNAVKWLSTGRQNVLVSPSEVKNLLTQTNKPISPTTRHILQNIENNWLA